ncbi:hypothetical protein ES705_18528 [subsurface metagenome]
MFAVTHKVSDYLVNRGALTGWDFSIDDLTADSNWHDLDLSSIIPAKATFVLLNLIIDNITAERSIRFRTKTVSGETYYAALHAQFGGRLTDGHYIVALDANRVIQYRATASGWIRLDINVIAWWLLQ